MDRRWKTTTLANYWWRNTLYSRKYRFPRCISSVFTDGDLAGHLLQESRKDQLRTGLGRGFDLSLWPARCVIPWYSLRCLGECKKGHNKGTAISCWSKKVVDRNPGWKCISYRATKLEERAALLERNQKMGISSLAQSPSGSVESLARVCLAINSITASA